MILDGFLNHSVPHIVGKETSREIWEVIVKIYWDPLENHKMILKEKLGTTKMMKG